MRLSVPLLKIFLLICLLVQLAGCRRAAESGANPGDRPIELSLPSVDGGTVPLSSFNGKPVFLHLWATWCGACLVELPEVQALSKAMDGRLQIVSVAVHDQKESVDKLRSEMGISFPVLMDDSGAFAESLKVNAFPESFILDKEGRFILFPDPDSGRLSIRAAGGRRWSDARFQSLLANLIFVKSN